MLLLQTRKTTRGFRGPSTGPPMPRNSRLSDSDHCNLSCVDAPTSPQENPATDGNNQFLGKKKKHMSPKFLHFIK